jgi:hypothetical protein
MKKYIVQFGLALIAFVIAYTILKQVDILDPGAAAKKLMSTGWFKLLNQQAQMFLLSNWQAPIAVLIAFGAFPFFAIPAKSLSERFLPGMPVFLYVPKSHQTSVDYTARTYPLVGCELEIRLLNEFLRHDRRFSWIWVTGSAGSGKSRILLEWVHALQSRRLFFIPSQYDAGFLLAGGKEFLKDWKPRRTTVIVVDDAVEKSHELVELFNHIDNLDQKQKLRKSVRVILLERSIPQELEPIAWQRRFLQARFRAAPLSLSPLSNHDVSVLAINAARRFRKPAILGKAIEQAIIDEGGGIPFFTILLLESYFTEGDMRAVTKTEVLGRYTEVLIGKYKSMGLKEQDLDAIALSTFATGVTWEQANCIAGPDTTYKKALLGKIGHSDVRGILPLKPDLLGEYYLLERFSRMEDQSRQCFRECGWRAAPDRVALTLGRLARDMVHHSAFRSLDQAPDTDEHFAMWGSVRGALIQVQSLSVTALDACWRDLRDAFRLRSDQHKYLVRFPVAWAAAGMVSVYGENEQWDDLEMTLAILRDITSLFQADTMMRSKFTQGHLNALRAFAWTQKWNEAKRMLAIIDEIAASLPGDSAIQVFLKQALLQFLKAASVHENWIIFDEVFPRAKSLAIGDLEDAESQNALVLATVNAFVHLGKNERWDDIRDLYQLSQKSIPSVAASSNPQPAIIAISNFLSNYRPTGKPVLWKEALDSLREQWRSASDRSLDYIFAAAAINAAYRFGSRQQLQEVRDISDLFGLIYKASSKDSFVQEHYIQSLGILVLLLANLGDTSELNVTFSRVRESAGMVFRNRGVRLRVGEAASYAIGHYCQIKMKSEAMAAWRYLIRAVAPLDSEAEARESIITAATSIAVLWCKERQWRRAFRVTRCAFRLGQKYALPIETKTKLAEFLCYMHLEFCEHGRWRDMRKTFEMTSILKGNEQSLAQLMDDTIASSAQLVAKKARVNQSTWKILSLYYAAKSVRTLSRAARLYGRDIIFMNSWSGSWMDVATSSPFRLVSTHAFAEAERILIRAEAIQEGAGAYNMACICALRGREEDCKNWLMKSLKGPLQPTRENAESDSDLAKVRGKQWFKEFCSNLRAGERAS